jgi:hypothetical protein
MPPYHGQLDDMEIFRRLRANIQECNELKAKFTQQSNLEANQYDLWRTLAVDSTRSWTRLGATYSDDLINFSEWLATNENQAPSDIPSVYLEYLEILNLRGLFIYRRFAIDSEGNMCVVPYSAEVNDKIAVVKGLSIPLVLRDKGSGETEIIGECYVHRHMDGEVTEGTDHNTFIQLVIV